MTESAREQRLRNVELMAQRRREQTHCKRGHPLTVGNLISRSDGHRECLICNRDRSDRSAARLFAQLLVNPNHWKHGTPRGYRVGCRCYRCCFAASEYRRRLNALKPRRRVHRQPT